jgi:CheY-like chemotaxis protein
MPESNRNPRVTLKQLVWNHILGLAEKFGIGHGKAETAQVTEYTQNALACYEKLLENSRVEDGERVIDIMMPDVDEARDVRRTLLLTRRVKQPAKDTYRLPPGTLAAEEHEKAEEKVRAAEKEYAGADSEDAGEAIFNDRG